MGFLKRFDESFLLRVQKFTIFSQVEANFTNFHLARYCFVVAVVLMSLVDIVMLYLNGAIEKNPFMVLMVGVLIHYLIVFVFTLFFFIKPVNNLEEEFYKNYGQVPVKENGTLDRDVNNSSFRYTWAFLGLLSIFLGMFHFTVFAFFVTVGLYFSVCVPGYDLE